MKHISTYNELYEDKDIKLDDNFIYALKRELSIIGFELDYKSATFPGDINEPYVDINKNGTTYIYFFLDYYNIEKLKKTCIDNLEEDKSSWECDVFTKDDYDLLCTTILVFIDEYSSVKKSYIGKRK